MQDGQWAPAALDPEQLRDLQLERLRQTLARVASNVSHYAQVFRDTGLAPGDIARLEDISKLPFTTKDDLRKAYPFGFFAVPRYKICRIHVSSGTTGTPTVVGYTERDLATWTGLMARCLATAGAGRGHLVHNAYGYGLFTGGLGFTTVRNVWVRRCCPSAAARPSVRCS